MADAQKQNELRREMKRKQRAAAKAKAVHKSKDEIDPFDWCYTASFDEGTLRSAAFLCREMGRDYIDTRGLYQLMKNGKLYLKINENQPLIGGELVQVLRDGFYIDGKKPKIKSISVSIVSPLSLTFKMMSDQRYKFTMNII